MQKIIKIILSPKEAASEEIYKSIVIKKLAINNDRLSHFQLLKKSIDARNSNIKINLEVFVVYDEPSYVHKKPDFNYQDVSKQQVIVVVGAGPAGLFSALRLIELGYKPIIFERGKTVSERKKDIALINRNINLNEDSNYGFGEGGAGTFSDGKLYTRSKKRGDTNKIFNILKFHGADEKILTDAHPHIGSDILPQIIVNIRNTIINAGGEINYESKVIDLIVENNEFKGVKLNNGDKFYARNVILATGHSARDIYELLHNKNIKLESKPFAMGVRVEHPQELIDSIQYHTDIRSNYLPAASYSLVNQVKDRGVYSFCMCPGGFIVPAATSQNEMLVNGMSPSNRNSPYANSGIVVEIKDEDLKEYSEYGVLAGLKFQQHLEKMAFMNGGSGQIAPAQRLHDFVNAKLSPSLPDSSYIPGLISSPIHFWLPENISSRLKIAFKMFGKKMFGFLTNDAVVLGVESRTSSPIRIPRDSETFEHVQVKGIYPCGEGAGYSGGIVSSAIDGEKCAEKIAEKINLFNLRT